MSIMDDVNALRNIASSHLIAVAEIREVKHKLLELSAKLIAILGPNFGANDDLRNRASNADIRLDSAVTALLTYETAIHDVADRIERTGG